LPHIFFPVGFLELTYDGYRFSWTLSRIAAGTNTQEEIPTILKMNATGYVETSVPSTEISVVLF